MEGGVVIGVIGDHDPKNPTHLATDAPVLAVTALAAPDQPGHDLRLEY
jgi:hypothetical protein